MLNEKQIKKLQRIAKCSPASLGLFYNVFLGKASPRKRIKAFCIECFGFDNNFRNDIRECTSPACPLFDLRPFQHKSKGEDGDDESEGGDVDTKEDAVADEAPKSDEVNL